MISASIIAIGDELLNGFTIDTNSQWIKEKLQKYRIILNKSLIIPDSKESIFKELENCLNQKVNFIFISGGLGPTHDDITKRTLSEYFDVPLVINEQHLSFLKKKFHKIIKQNTKLDAFNKIEKGIRTQAEILEGFEPITNSIGTALGMTGEINKTRIFVLPGVPKELKNMIEESILPNYLILDPSLPVKTLKTTGITESNLFVQIEDIIHSNKSKFKFSILPHFTGVNIRITQLKEELSINNIIKKLLDQLNEFCYGYDNDTIEEVTSNLLARNNITLSIAESCTGGLITKKITDTSGSSKFLKGSIVAYSNEIKNSILKVPNDILNNYGAVSSEVALSMAKNIARYFKTDLGVSITGISGPSGGSKEKPVGLYYIGISFGEHHFSKKFITGINDRKTNREISSDTALNLIRLTIRKYHEK